MSLFPKIFVGNYIKPNTYVSGTGNTRVGSGVPTPRPLVLTHPQTGFTWAPFLTVSYPSSNGSTTTFTPILNSNLPIHSADWNVRFGYSSSPWFSSTALLEEVPGVGPWNYSALPNELEIILTGSGSHPAIQIPSNPVEINTSVLATNDSDQSKTLTNTITVDESSNIQINFNVYDREDLDGPYLFAETNCQDLYYTFPRDTNSWNYSTPTRVYLTGSDLNPKGDPGFGVDQFGSDAFGFSGCSYITWTVLSIDSNPYVIHESTIPYTSIQDCWIWLPLTENNYNVNNLYFLVNAKLVSANGAVKNLWFSIGFLYHGGGV